MVEITSLKNQIQEYSWGSRTAIAEIMGKTIPSKAPQAELWMGAHPKAPSEVYIDNSHQSLLELINAFPKQILGSQVASRFQNTLPFLFKLLAADQPLSIQVHPNLAQARAGFIRENEMRIPLTAPNRNYKDGNHKPEILCALTPFWGLNGFRPISEIIDILSRISSSTLEPVKEILTTKPDAMGLKQCLTKILTLQTDCLHHAVLETITFAHSYEDENPLFRWLIRLNEIYPGDVGVLCAMLLNLICLQPGEAMFLPAGRLHAYLDGVGIELMANSDNVLRGGLTPKHIDIHELLKLLNFSQTKVETLKPVNLSPSEQHYPTQAKEFALSKIIVSKNHVFSSKQDRSVEIMICTQGKGDLINLSTGIITPISRGGSVIIPASVMHYQIKGDATLFKAAVPD